MQVREIMSPEPSRIEADGTVAQAATLMKDRNVGVLPVTSGGRVVGMLSDRDVIVRAVALGLDPKVARVGQVMTHGPVACKAADDVGVATELMRRKKIRRLLVADEGGQPVGFVSLGDLAANPKSAPQACEVLSHMCGGLQDRTRESS